MVEEVKELGAELQDHVLCQRRVFENGEVELFEARAFQGVAAEVAEVSGSRSAVGFVGTDVVSLGVSPCAWCSEWGQVQILSRILGVLERTNQVRPVKAFTRSGII